MACGPAVNYICLSNCPHEPTTKTAWPFVMEALAGLSIAANVLQVISFTRDTVSLFSKIYHKQTASPDLTERANKIRTLGEDLEFKLSQSTSIITQSQRPSIKSQLPALCHEVIYTAQELASKLSRPVNGKCEALKATLKIKLGRSSNISDLDKKLGHLEQTLQTKLLSDIWSKQDAALFQQQQSFDALDHKLKDIIQGYAQGQIDLRTVIQQDYLITTTKLLDDLQLNLSAGIDRTIQHVTQVVQSSEEARSIARQKLQLLNSVRFPARNARKSAIQNAYPDTFNWIYKAPDDDSGSKFRKWMVEDESPVFWIKGKPGSGKSTLMKFLTSSKQTLDVLPSQYPRHAIYSHFIWISDNSVDGTLRGLLCSLIHQILEADTNDCLIESLIKDYPESRQRLSPLDWEIDELQLVLQELIRHHQGFVVIFIDGLDELISGEDKFLLRDLTESIFRNTRHLKLCISSRPEPDLKLLLSGFPFIELHDLTKHDLETVARDSLQKHFHFALRAMSLAELNNLVNIIVHKAEGVFLWITLTLVRIRKGTVACDTMDELIDSLKATPSDLIDLYRKMWDRLGPDQKRYEKDAAFVFKCLIQWNKIIAAPSPLTCFHLTICRERPPETMFMQLMNNKSSFLQSPDFQDACLRTRRQIEYCCAGLVEFTQIREGIKGPMGDDDGLLMPPENDPRTWCLDFIHRSLRDFVCEGGLSLLEQPDDEKPPDKEVVYAAIFRALVSETVTRERRETSKMIDLRTYKIHIDVDQILSLHKVYKDYTWMEVSVFSNFWLTRALHCCRLWMQHAQSLISAGKAFDTMWDRLSQRIFKSLERAFESFGDSNLLEQKAIYLDDIFPAVAASSAVLSHLPTYLIWQKLSPIWGNEVHEYPDYAQLFGRADMEWSYPHTVMAAGHGIPQLLTIPEKIIGPGSFMLQENLLVLLQHMKKYPSRWYIGSVFLLPDRGANLGHQCGIQFPYLHPVVLDGYCGRIYDASAIPRSFDADCYEVILRVSNATMVNRCISKALSPPCPHIKKSWVDAHDSELRNLICPEPQTGIEVLLVGHFSRFFGGISCTPTTVLDARKLVHNGIHNAIETNPLFEMALASHQFMFQEGRMQFFTASPSQSRAISSKVDPDFLMEAVAGPYDQDVCRDCLRDSSENSKVRQRFDQLNENRATRVSAIQDIITEISTAGDNRVCNVLEHLRSKGHYVPTEEDLFEFITAKSAFEKVEVLERLNKEKAEKQAWMDVDVDIDETTTATETDLK